MKVVASRARMRQRTGRAGMRVTAAAVVSLVSVVGLEAAPANAAGVSNKYVQTNLVSDIPGVARVTDPNLVNPWGMAASPTSPVWVSDNGTDKSTLYSGDIAGSPLLPASLVVDIPGGSPTGQVFNPTTDFVVHSGAASGPAVFIFASESGNITGWAPAVPPPAPSTQAQLAASTPDAVYKGLALASTGSGNFLYAANFHAGTIDVFNGSFAPANLTGSFTDPALPAGYAPFNIQNLGGKLFVTYAKQDADRHDEVDGPGKGFVDVYDVNGGLLQRLVSGGPLNAPWGLALAPAGFGKFRNDLLVGNFGDGKINAFDPVTGQFEGKLRNQDAKPIAIDGLWGLQFGNGRAGSPNTLLFTAGIAHEAHGLLGAIDVQ